MLNFLKKQQEGSASGPVESVEREHDDGFEFDSLETAMEELFAAKSPKERAAAFRAAFELLEEQPHDEAPHNG